MADRTQKSSSTSSRKKSKRPARQASADAKALTTKVTVDFDPTDARLSRLGPYTAVDLRGGVPRAEVGDPALPWKAVYVSLPTDCSIRDVEVVPSRVKRLAKGVLVEPRQPDVPTIIGEDARWIDADRERYEARPQWPEQPARAPTLRETGGHVMAEIELCPFRYDPVGRVLEFVQRMVVTISFTRTGELERRADTPYVARLDDKFARRVQTLVLNPEHVLDYARQADFGLWFEPIAFPTYDYVIITTRLGGVDQAFERLAHWRTIMGLRARVVTVEDIEEGTVPDTGGATFFHASGYSDGGTRDRAEAIRNFLKWAVEHWLIDYVLLGGDTEIIPCRYALHTRAGRAGYRDLTDTLTYKAQLLHGLAASSQPSGSEAGKAGDDDPATVWECAAGDADPWIGGQLGVNRPINRVDLGWGANHATAYVIEISDDGVAWTQIHSQSAGSGGNEQIDLTPTSAQRLRLRVTSGTSFSLASIAVYGPHHYKYGGTAYAFGATATRLYLSVSMVANPTIDGPQLLIHDGPNAGSVVPYDESSSATSLGWRFIERLTDSSPVVSTTPTQFIEVRGPAAYHGHEFALKTDLNYIPTDLYYSDTLTAEYPPSGEHDWDLDGNLIYGERYGGQLDGVNGVPDVLAGRASVETAAEAAIFVDKVIAYERYLAVDEFGVSFTKPFDVATSVLLGSENWSHTNTVGVLDGSARGKEQIRTTLRAIDPNRFSFTRRYEDEADVPAADQGTDLDGFDTAEIVAGIEANNHVISLSSHGNSGYLCGLSSFDVNTLENFPGLVYGNACSTNKFDVPFGEALGELALLNSAGAGVAYVGNSRFGWTGDNPMELAFWSTWAGCERLGEAYNAAKSPTFGGWQAYSLNLVGDPGMRIWNDTPRQIEVTHPDEACAGAQDFEVEVESGGVAVAGAQVCVTMASALFQVATTDSSGRATLSLSSSATGTLRVSVSGRNLLPYLGSAEVVSCLGGCTSVVACGQAIQCLHGLACAEAIQCAEVIACGSAIYDECRELLGGCSAAIDMCPAILPDDWFYFDHVRDRWALNNLVELAERIDEPEVRLVLDRTPEELRKPLLAMLDRIRAEAFG